MTEKGTITGLSGAPMSGLWTLTFDTGAAAHISSGTGVRALARAFGDLGNIIGQKIYYELDCVGVMECFTPAAVWEAIELTHDLDKVVQGYLATAIWSSTDDDGNSLDRFSIDDIILPARDQAREDCDKFLRLAWQLLEAEDADASTVGHDFWLTRNGHGAGYWDGDYKNGDALTEIASAFGEKYVYITDDGDLDIS